MRALMSLGRIVFALICAGVIVAFRACTEQAHGGVCDSEQAAAAVDLSPLPASLTGHPASFLENPPDWIVSPWCWVAVLLVSHVLMLILFVKGLRANAEVDEWDDTRAIAANSREQSAIRKLPLLEPEPDPEALLAMEMRAET